MLVSKKPFSPVSTPLVPLGVVVRLVRRFLRKSGVGGEGLLFYIFPNCLNTIRCT